MSRYYSFNDYMNDVITEADAACQQLKNCRLNEFAKVSERTFDGITKIINRNWNVFSAIVAFLLNNAGSIFIVGLIAAFLGTPIGLIVGAVLGASAAIVIREMYTDKILTPAVRETGEKFKDQWERLDGERKAIDALVKEAADFLLWKVGIK